MNIIPVHTETVFLLHLFYNEANPGHLCCFSNLPVEKKLTNLTKLNQLGGGLTCYFYHHSAKCFGSSSLV